MTSVATNVTEHERDADATGTARPASVGVTAAPADTQGAPVVVVVPPAAPAATATLAHTPGVWAAYASTDVRAVARQFVADLVARGCSDAAAAAASTPVCTLAISAYSTDWRPESGGELVLVMTRAFCASASANANAPQLTRRDIWSFSPRSQTSYRGFACEQMWCTNDALWRDAYLKGRPPAIAIARLAAFIDELDVHTHAAHIPLQLLFASRNVEAWLNLYYATLLARQPLRRSFARDLRVDLPCIDLPSLCVGADAAALGIVAPPPARAARAFALVANSALHKRATWDEVGADEITELYCAVLARRTSPAAPTNNNGAIVTNAPNGIAKAQVKAAPKQQQAQKTQ